MKLNPQCVEHISTFVLSNTGYMFPCCDLDNTFAKEDPRVKKLIQDHLYVDNVNSLDEIMLSEEWVEFFDVIFNDQDNAPNVCKRRCGKGIDYGGKLVDRIPAVNV